MSHPYYRLSNGNLVSKQRVDAARQLLDSLMDGFTVTELDDYELFAKGDKFEAIKRWYDKYGCSLREAKASIEKLRGENKN